MAREDDTPDGHTRRLISDEVQLPQTGVVTNVHEHTSPDDRWNFHLDVRIGPETHPRKIPLATAIPNLIAPPRGPDHPDGPDQVLVQYLNDDGTERPVATHVLYNDEDRALLGHQGDVRVRRGDLEVELAGDGSTARLVQRSDPAGSPDLVVEVGDDNQVRLGKPDGDLKPVARQGDSVSGSTSDGASFTGTIDEGSSDVSSS